MFDAARKKPPDFASKNCRLWLHSELHILNILIINISRFKVQSAGAAVLYKRGLRFYGAFADFRKCM